MHYRLTLKKEKLQDWRTLEGILIADTSSKLEEVEKILRESDRYAVDTEFAGLMNDGSHWNIDKNSPVGKVRAVSVQFSTPEVPRIFVPNWGEYEGNIQHLKKVLEDTTPKSLLHNAKADAHVFANHGIGIFPSFLADTMVMDFCYNTAEYHGLKECIKRYFGEDTVEYRETFQQPVPLKRGGYGKAMFLPHLFDIIKTEKGIHKLVDYSTKDTVYTLRLYDFLRERLESTPWAGEYNMYHYYECFDRPYTEVLFEMERRGCLIDLEKLKEVQKTVEEQCATAKKKFFKECVTQGVSPKYLETFNLASGKQLGTLFDTHLKVNLTERTKTGQFKTDDDALLKIKGAPKKVVAQLLEFKKMDKLRSTYVEPLLHIHQEYNGKVHTSFKQIGTNTSRLSSANINLQNIPGHSDLGMQIRAAFIAPKGCEMGDIDLSMIEMRIAAHFSQDQEMLRAIREDWDLHSLSALKANAEVQEWMAGRSPTKELLEEIKQNFKDTRDRLGKTLNFSILYGAGPFKIADIAGISETAATTAIAGFFDYYKDLKRFMDNTKRYCRKHGYVTTLLRRRLHIPGINAEKPGIRMQAERQCVNYVIQGTAAELLKMSMILIHKCPRLREMGVRMILQVHDELVFEVPMEHKEESKALIEEYVSHPYRFPLVYGNKLKDLLVDTPGKMGYGDSWATAK